MHSFRTRLNSVRNLRSSQGEQTWTNIAITSRAFLPTALKPKAHFQPWLVVAWGARDQLQLFDADSGPAISEPKGESNEVLTNVLVDGAIGTVVGTGIGALAQLAIVAGSVSLFVASPLVAPLVMLGWGASLGAFVGAAAGANAGVEHKDGWLSDLVHDAIASGQVVLVVQTRTGQKKPKLRARLSARRLVNSKTSSAAV